MIDSKAEAATLAEYQQRPIGWPLEKYRVDDSKFQKYHDALVKNFFERKGYGVTLEGDKLYYGIPSICPCDASASLCSLEETKFKFEWNNQIFYIPLQDAKIDF